MDSIFMDSIKEFAHSQIGNEAAKVTVSDGEFAIVDPWYSSTPDGKYLSDDEAIEMWGEELVQEFISKAKDYLTRKQIKDTFYEEVLARGAWCAHCYAPEYFMELTSDIEKILGHKIVSAKDYDLIIKKVYTIDDVFTSSEKCQIADALSDEFLSLLEKEVENL